MRVFIKLWLVNRRVTDWPWIIVFIIFNGGLLFHGITCKVYNCDCVIWTLSLYIAYSDGRASRLTRGMDFRSEICGLNKLKDYPYLYFFQPVIDINVAQCVKQCPTTAVMFINSTETTNFDNLILNLVRVAFLYFLIVMKLFNRVNLAIGIIKATSRLIKILSQTKWVPWILIICEVCLGIWTVACAVLAFGIGEVAIIKAKSNSQKNRNTES